MLRVCVAMFCLSLLCIPSIRSVQSVVHLCVYEIIFLCASPHNYFCSALVFLWNNFVYAHFYGTFVLHEQHCSSRKCSTPLYTNIFHEPEIRGNLTAEYSHHQYPFYVHYTFEYVLCIWLCHLHL
eukprot:200123_1